MARRDAPPLRVLLVVSGSLGDTLPLLGIAHTLRARGHQVVFATGLSTEAAIRSEGFADVTLVPPHFRPDMLPELEKVIMDASTGWTSFERLYLLPTMGEALELLLPLCRRCDVLVTGFSPYAAPVAAEVTGVPWVSVFFTPLFFNSAHCPPALAPLPWLPRLCAPLPLRARRCVLDALREVGAAHNRGALDALRAAHGLPSRGDAATAALSPHACLLLASPVLHPTQPDWPASCTTTGAVPFDALTSEAPAVHPEDAPALEALRAFLAAPGATPPVVFALGSLFSHMSTSAALVALFVDAMAAMPRGTRAVIVTGRVAWRAFEERGVAVGAAAAAAQLVAVPWAPYSELFPHAAAVVHQGGAGTSAKAALAGVPTVIYPHTYDTYDTAAHLARCGASLTLPLKALSPAALAAALRRLLAEPHFAASAAALAAAMRAEGDGAERAADEIERLVARSREPDYCPSGTAPLSSGSGGATAAAAAGAAGGDTAARRRAPAGAADAPPPLRPRGWQTHAWAAVALSAVAGGVVAAAGSALGAAKALLLSQQQRNATSHAHTALR